MICNLNQLTFQKFGAVESERTRTRDMDTQAPHSCVVELDMGPAPIYQMDTEVWLCNHSDMTVLSVSLDGANYQNFYLDKRVTLKPGIRFALHPYQERSRVEMVSAEKLHAIGWSSDPEDFRMRRRIQVNSIYTFFYHEKEKGFMFSGEAHKPLELTYVDKGSIHSVADGRDMVLNQGELVIYGPDQWHMQYADADVSASYITVSFDLDGEFPGQLINRKFAIPQSAASSLQRMIQESERMDEYSQDMVICHLQMIMLMLLREEAGLETAKLQAANTVNSENEIIRRAQQYISANVRRKLTVPVVAKYVDVSPSYLTALFRKHLQISPGEYVRRVKLQESKKMIREDNMNFTEIAAVLQYSTVHHFSRQFKDKFGITPTEYAKSVR